MWIIRDARPRDLEPLSQLAASLNTVNLPAQREVIQELINASQESLRRQRGPRKPLLFVLERWSYEAAQGWGQEVLGSCMIIPQHGTHERPASYFKIMERQKYSSILKRHFKHQTLELIFDYDGPTELGGLVLSPQLRGHPLKLGRFLSYARLALIASPSRRAWFQDEVVAELLPALGPERDSELWTYLGQRFTGLDYHSADKLSREHIHFIQELFPHAPLYTALLPERVQRQLGEVGPESRPAAHLLSRVGFSFDGTIDPFDGGPTYRVKTDECTLVKRTVVGSWAHEESPSELGEAWEMGALIIDHLDQGGGLKILMGAGAVQPTDAGSLSFIPTGLEQAPPQALAELLSVSPGAPTSFTPFAVPAIPEASA